MDAPRRSRLPRALLALATLVAALALPASASAFQLEIVNQSGVPDSEVWITVASPEPGYSAGLTNDEPVQLSNIAGSKFAMNSITSGRVFVAYGKEGATETQGAKVGNIGWDAPFRFDWTELTTGATGVANLTAVDQFAIGMRLETIIGGQVAETIGEANADTVFDALQGIPGGPGATVRGANGEILRVLSPVHSSSYPELEGYLRSMAGQTIVLHTNALGDSSRYVGTFAADGSATLTGETDPPGQANATITIPAAELLRDIDTGENTPNTLEGALRRDLYTGFVTGLWGGKYGNDSVNYCTNPGNDALGAFCPKFDIPAFGDARTALPPYPTCNQYAAVINQFSDSYGYAYSDASKNTVVQVGSPSLETLRLTILPDSGSALPVNSGNPNCGAGPAVVPPAAPAPAAAPAPRIAVAVNAKLLDQTKLLHGKLRVARLRCTAACGGVRAVVHEGRKVVARGLIKQAGPKAVVFAKPTKPGRALLADAVGRKLRLDLWVTPAGQAATHLRHSLTLK